jgi:xylulokinase
MAITLGLDSSTQSMKALVIDSDSGKIVASAAVNFGKDLAGYGCPEGVLAHPDPLVKHSPPLMWLEALDLVLSRLQAGGAPMGDIMAISGDGQQHGSVYLNADADRLLAGLDPARTLPAQLAPALSRSTSPIWMDSSTSTECREIEAVIGPRLQTDTGSPAIERFTGPQIRKFFKTSPGEYERTSRIHLVSSFMCSVLIGKHAAIDFGDGAGMNLLNLKTGDWDDAVLEATAPGLRAKLPPARPATEIAGGLHAYFAKYGLKPGIPVVLWTGDNPSSLIGVGASEPGVAVISLGTSDTFFAAMPAMKTDPDGYGHVFGNPAGGVMSLICFKNGSLARERIKDECHVDWAYLDGAAMTETQPGNQGNRALSYYVPEITPRVLTPGVRRQGTPDFCAGKAPAAVKIRANLEGQVCSMRILSAWIGSFKTIRVTGGASRSKGIVKLIADIFQADVEKIAVADSATLGGAMRAAHAAAGVPLKSLAAQFAAATETIRPDTGKATAYAACTEAYKTFIRGIRD